MTVGGGLHNREPERPRSSKTRWRLARERAFWLLFGFGYVVVLAQGGLVTVVLTAVLAALAGGIAIGYTGRGNEDFTRFIERWR